MNRIIHAVFGKDPGNTVYTQSAAQYDKGVVLRISGIALPETYEVHFSNHEDEGVSTALSESGSDIVIPDAYLQNGKYIYVWIYLGDEHKNGYSGYMAVVPVQSRPAILDMTDIQRDLVADYDPENHALIFH